MNKLTATTDPLADPSLRGPGIWRILRELSGGVRRVLDTTQIEVTSFCCAECSYCPHTIMRDSWKTRHMAEKTYASLWPVLLESKRAHLQGWGEPLLHPRFTDMVRLAVRAGCAVSTTTCGLVMSDNLAGDIIDAGMDTIAFSLAGTSARSHNAARKGADYARVLDAVRLFQKTCKKKVAVHVSVHLAYLMTAGNMREVRGLPELMLEIGVDTAVVSTLDYLPKAEWADEAFAPHEEEKIAEARQELQKAAAHAEKLGMRIHCSLPSPEPGFTCAERPDRAVYIDADGNLSPCIYANIPTVAKDARRRIFGNCLKDNPLDIWRDAPFADFRKGLAQKQPDAICRDCPKRFMRQ
jgi:MoaA/NifB/PqqE/SkfB family radical SAM enzyme